MISSIGSLNLPMLRFKPVTYKCYVGELCFKGPACSALYRELILAVLFLRWWRSSARQVPCSCQIKYGMRNTSNRYQEYDGRNC